MKCIAWPCSNFVIIETAKGGALHTVSRGLLRQYAANGAVSEARLLITPRSLMARGPVWNHGNPVERGVPPVRGPTLGKTGSCGTSPALVHVHEAVGEAQTPTMQRGRSAAIGVFSRRSSASSEPQR